MKPIKEPFFHSVNFVLCSFVIALLLVHPWLFPASVAYAEAPAVSAAAPTLPTIMGGQPAETGEWPWQAAVMVNTNFCGGTLIHPSWVLTAAHCLYTPTKERYPTDAVQIVLGDYNLYVAEAHEQHFTVDQVLIHPDVNLATYNNDIALLHLTTPATINDYVKPLALTANPEDDALVASGTLATVTGWGATKENGSLTPVLREVVVPLIANADCRQSYGMLTDNMLCAGYAEGSKDACAGDSGGPLMVPDAEGKWKLAGLVSFGYGCGRPLFYGVYTRIANYVAWIEATTGSLDLPLGVTIVDATATPTVVPTITSTVVITDSIRVTPEANVSPTPVPPTPSAPLPTPTQVDSSLPAAQSFLPVVHR